jgi:hypothetical protein
MLISTAATFRGLSAILAAQRSCGMIEILKTPSHTTTRRWINQVGYYNLTKPLEKGDDWVYFIDNSIRMENRKVCLILGTRLPKLKIGQYLCYEDLEVVEMRLIRKNKDLELILEDAILRTGIPCQICSDTGPDIMPSIKKIIAKYPKIQHVPDIMHKVGNILKKMLQNNDRWNSFLSLLNESRKRLCQSALSFMCPPNIRGKSRFLNCSNVIEWCNKALKVVENANKTDENWEELNEKLGWLWIYKEDLALFTELFGLAGMAKEIVRKLHIGKDTWQISNELLAEEAKSSEGKQFVKEVIDFLKMQCEKAESKTILVGSSEIIESAFSKLKQLDRECGNRGFTKAVLGLGACFGKTDFKSMEKAFIECNYKDVLKWEETHVGETVEKKRRQILKFEKPVDFGSKIARFIEGERMHA